MLGLGAAAVVGGAALERFDQFARDISNKELRHAVCYHVIACPTS
jgi:hypothetical protein